MKKNTLLIVSLLTLGINLHAGKMVKYCFDPSTAAFTNMKGKTIPIDGNKFMLPDEIVSNKQMLSLVSVGWQKWLGCSTYYIKKLAEHQGKISFLMGFKADKDNDYAGIVFYFEQWPGLSNLPSHFSQEVKGVMFLPFFPEKPSVDFVYLQPHVKVPLVQAKSWQKLPIGQSIALPCYVLFDRERLVFGVSPDGPFFTLNLEGKDAVFQRRFTRTSKSGKVTCTSGPVGITKAYKLSTFNVNIYEN